MNPIKGLLAALFFFYWPGSDLARTSPGDFSSMTWQLVEVKAADQATLGALAGAGIEIISRDEAGRLEVLVNQTQYQWLDSLGLAPRVLIGDYGRYLAGRGRAEAGLAAVEALADGSMGGYYSPAEVRAFIDTLAARDTHGIVSDTTIIGFSHWNNPLWVVKISADPATDQDLPEVFYNSLIHSRESMSGMILLYFMRYLVDNYGVVDSVTELINSRELYFMPLANPDGYQINWDIYRNSQGLAFGLWRKNARDNNTNGAFDQFLDGVDLNRNFPFQWGYDILGSSNDRTMESYRGPLAASEPETQALRDFINARSFSAAINFHTYSSVLINPFNYRNLQTPDSLLYGRLGKRLTAVNGYKYGNAIQTLGYTANGELTDWEYADSTLRGKIMSWTGEIGAASDGFWPARTKIPQNQKQNLALQLELARVAGFWPELDSLSLAQPADSVSLRLHFTLSNHGVRPNREPLSVRLRIESEQARTADSVRSLADMGAAAVPPAARDSLLVIVPGSAFSFPAALEVYEGGRRLRSFPFQLSGNLSAFDLTRDGKVNIFDLLDLLKTLANGPSGSASLPRYDLDRDGKVGVFDLIALLKELAKQ